MNWNLVSFVTSDKIQLNGIMSLPAKVSGVVIFVHGFTGSFTSRYNFFEMLTERLESAGWGVLAFNNRGHGVINKFHKIDPRKDKGYSSATVGGIYEKFEDCVQDIDAAVNFVQLERLCDIILCGSSTGANKVAYSAAYGNLKNLIGVVLMSGVSDIEANKNDLGGKYDYYVKRAKNLVNQGKGRTLIELGTRLPTPDAVGNGGQADNFISAARLVSMTDESGNEDVFSYTQSKPEFGTLRKIKVPVLAVYGEKDEYMKVDKKRVLGLLAKAVGEKNFQGKIIKGADHSFSGHEREVVATIQSWISTKLP